MDCISFRQAGQDLRISAVRPACFDFDRLCKRVRFDLCLHTSIEG